MADAPIDLSIYGAQPIPDNLRMPGTQAAVPAAPAQVPIAGAVAQGLGQSYATGQADLNAALNKPEATLLESAGAAVKNWSVVHAWDSITQPTFAAKEGYNPADSLPQVPFQLSNPEEKLLLASRSQEEFQYKLDSFKQHREELQAMGDHPVVSFGMGLVDPGYLAIDMASMGVARAARLAGLTSGAQRFVAGAAAFAGTYGLGKLEQVSTPMTEAEVFGNAMFNGAMTGVMYRDGHMVPRDEGFPSQELQRVVRESQGGQVERAELVAVRNETAEALAPVSNPQEVPLRMVAGTPVGAGKVLSARAVLAELTGHADPLISVLAKRVDDLLVDDLNVVQVPKEKLIGGSRAYYDPGSHSVFIQKNSTAETKLHELTHALTAHKIEYGSANPTSAHGQIVQEITSLREQALRAYEEHRTSSGVEDGHEARTRYFLKDNHEFISGVFSGSSPFTDFLKSLPVEATKQRSVLGSVVDSIRRLLGMQPSEVNGLTHAIGLTEALGKERLNVTLHRGQNVIGPDGITPMPGNGSSVRLDAPDVPVPAAQANKDVAKVVADKLSWSLNKTLGAFSDTAKRISDFLVDNPLDMSGDSVVSQHRAVRADFQRLQNVYEDILGKTMAERGFGLRQRITSPRAALAEQQAIEREVGAEMLRRNKLDRDGLPIDKTGIKPEITKMADALDNVAKFTRDEMKRSGVAGAEDLVDRSGYFSRKWDYSRMYSIEQRMIAGGATAEAAKQSLVDAITIGIARANGFDAQLSRDVAGAIYDRARRKGYFEDSAIRTHQGSDTVAEVSDVLDRAGLSGNRKQQVMEILTGKNDEAGKLNSLKRRVDIAMDESITMPDGSTATVADMIDMSMATITDRYLDSAAAQVAFARKGLSKPSDIADLRKSLLESIPTETSRNEARKLFDSTIDYLVGKPTGDDVPKAMRLAQGVTRMVSLRRSGLFQFTEYATMLGQYGGVRTMGQIFKEMPFFRSMYDSPQEATHLRNILAGNASQDLRIRPFIQRMEDNFEIPATDAMQLSMAQAEQLVPYANGLKYIQGHQSRVAANLIVDTFVRGANGEAKAVEALAKYGLEPRIMIDVADDIKRFGADTTKWSDGTYEAVRGPLTKMMDDAVLRNRTGEIPAFAQFSSVGKFIFTFRSFLLGSHNKVLAGSLYRDGFSGLGMLMLYQFPMTFAAMAADAKLSGKPVDDKKLYADAFGQMSSMGLFSEAIGVAFGNKQQFGSPGTIAFDKVYGLGAAASNSISQGSAGPVSAAAFNSVPLLSIILPAKAIGEALKDNKKE